MKNQAYKKICSGLYETELGGTIYQICKREFGGEWDISCEEGGKLEVIFTEASFRKSKEELERLFKSGKLN